MSRPRRLLVALLALALLAAACGSDDDATPVDGTDTLGDATITVYSSRSEELIQPVFDAFETATGATVEVRYGKTDEITLALEAEGDRSPADVYIGQSPGAVGFLDQAGLLAPLGAATLDRVGAAYRASSGNWVGITGRVRVLVYNTDRVDPAELPGSILDLTDPAFAGRVGVAPGNGSFQDFVTAMRADLGDEATGEWLAGMAANDSPNYEKNGAIVDAVARGEVDMGLVNHYYLLEFLEEDPSLPAANYTFPEGDLGSLLITSAAGVVSASDQPANAEALIQYLLSDEAQAQSAAGESEYPLVAGVAAPEGLAPLAELAAITVDLDVLADGLRGTQSLIENSGLIQ
ncbi:MAG: extracellular solute-binding protein [Acidimicrobiales bacterium]|nr:extracellular solute-binding protein [Acidimicrobiales bacterium]